ncbi:hypothetical protein K437DRAFT_254964 [Tilletiaria anomala UBC 951]|uniref:Uncharacterized protein n=1 Tax=Tilletiaria anomala (strain ATCC 24038 / CBS 436.72 / UBC 951) TaxID=1037660 RepID=A0A066WE37_TILAU|nr:uncharacterized protein K437DRAFT_254964 [Tilletiaria anomala UBC 951]KDN50798.1 hypothetical protein K437DRAFT_254964 [Tilletiaria anomala UBC 951]
MLGAPASFFVHNSPPSPITQTRTKLPSKMRGIVVAHGKEAAQTTPSRAPAEKNRSRPATVSLRLPVSVQPHPNPLVETYRATRR